MISTIVVAAMISMAAPGADFYVATDGSDTNPGTEQAPFATPAQAQEAIRGLVAAGLAKDVTVFIRGGVYRLEEPLLFGPQDSGTEAFSVTYAAYPGEAVVLSGGRTIGDWRKGKGGLWTATAPEAASGQWPFRQLFADGVRLPRGRFPNAPELLRVKEVSEDVKTITLRGGLDVGDLAGGDAELVMYQNWSISRSAIVSTDGATVQVDDAMGWIGHGSMTTASRNKPAYLENALEFVDQPGEWYLDGKTGEVTYMAAKDEDPNERTFVAPRLEQLVVVAGTPDAPVRNVRFQGLAFEHTHWPLPAFGYMGIQAGHHGTRTDTETHVLPLALEFTYAENCALEHCTIAHTGATGIGFGQRCRANRVEACELDDIGGNGIMVGWRGKAPQGDEALAGDPDLAADWVDPDDAPLGNAITHCAVRRCGAVNHGCVGIFDAFSAETRIAHNLVTEMPYTGVSIGFRWDTSPTTQRGCVVEYNHIHDVMRMLADGGCIYTLGLQPGTVLRGNVLHNVHRSAYAHGGAPNNGIFFDQGSKSLHVESNTIYDTSGNPVRFNQCKPEDLTWKDNSFGLGTHNAVEPG